MDYTRQRDFFNPTEVNASATIAGCGGIGSFTAFALAKLGVQHFTLIDFDTVDEHNLPNQMFSVASYDFADGDVGRLKVDALADQLYNAGAEYENITTIAAPLQDGIPMSDVV